MEKKLIGGVSIPSADKGCQLITYAERLGGRTLNDLHDILDQYSLTSIFTGGIHMLPTIFPNGGQDGGFDNLTHVDIDPSVGDWDGIRKIGQKVPVMVDLVVNHISDKSKEFQDYLRHGDDSEYAEMFLLPEKVFGRKPTDEDWEKVYKPRDGKKPVREVAFANGEKKEVWKTFTPSQIDIDVESQKGWEYIIKTLNAFEKNGIKWIRLDAAGYAIKRPGTSCFMLPETFDFIEKVKKEAIKRDIQVLVETHTHHSKQREIANKVDWVYDFALPPLILHALHFKTTKFIKNWLKDSPRNALTVLDTHDGIGMIDAEDLIPDVNALKDKLMEFGGNETKRATGENSKNVDTYQVNCTFYDALGRSDKKYLIARAIQLFSPGLPQIYYVGLLAGRNDGELLERTGVGRDVNRHFYTRDELHDAIASPVVRRQLELIKFRNTCPAFKDCPSTKTNIFEINETDDHILHIIWTNLNGYSAELIVNVEKESIKVIDNGEDITDRI